MGSDIIAATTADDTKCAGCGHPFMPRSRACVRLGYGGLYHKRCVPAIPATDRYHAGRLSGLREAVERLESQADEADRFADICAQDGDGARALEALAQALEEAAKLADERGAATTATAIRALIAPAGEE